MNKVNQRKIELELRAEVMPQEYKKLKKTLGKTGMLDSYTKRLSVMYFGKSDKKNLDIRVRITNGECEVVIKSGQFHSHDRVEISQKINSDQFLGLVRIFEQFGFDMEIGERETFNYKLPGEVVVSLVSAGSIFYVELEKMSSKFDLAGNNKQLKRLASNLNLRILNSNKEFDILCKRLSTTVDWPFHGSDKNYITLNRLIKKYINYKKNG